MGSVLSTCNQNLFVESTVLRCAPNRVYQDSLRLLREKTTRKGRPGGREDNRGSLTFSNQWRVVAWNCSGLSNSPLQLRIVEATRQGVQKTELSMFEDATESNQQRDLWWRKNAWRVLVSSRDLTWNWLGHILRMGELQAFCQVLLYYVKPTPESTLGDMIHPDVNAAIFSRRKTVQSGRRRGPRNAASPVWGINAEYISLRHYLCAILHFNCSLRQHRSDWITIERSCCFSLTAAPLQRTIIRRTLRSTAMSLRHEAMLRGSVMHGHSPSIGLTARMRLQSATVKP